MPKRPIGPQLPAGFDKVDNNQSSDIEDRSIYETGIGDARGFYADGAYIARSLSESGDNVDEEGEDADNDGPSAPEAIHAAYFRSLLDKYWSLRSALNAPAPPESYARLPKTALTSVRSLNIGTTIETWRRLISSTDPHPVQLSLMSKESVLRVIRIVLGGKRFLKAGHPVSERTSRWLWALLARFPERGELDHTEIAWVRELGRRAVLLGRSLAEMAALRAELEMGGLGMHDGVDESESDDEEFGMYDEVEANKDSAEVAAKTRNQPKAEASQQDLTSAKPKDPEPAPPPAKVEYVPTTETKQPPNDSDHEDGEVSDDEGVPMDLSSERGEEGENGGQVPEESLEDAKARLLAQVEASAEDERLAADEATRQRSRMNMRATLNMILTVAGEVYGQRDLLQFREPFVGM